MGFFDGFSKVIDGIKSIFGGMGQWLFNKVIK